jgi:hypothetical protein
VNRSREEARHLRTGRAWASYAAGRPVPDGPSAATSYASVTAELDVLRTTLDANTPRSTPLANLRRSHEGLARALARAIALAFAADANGAPTLPGITTWAAEGLARSYERELAMLAAMDICGLAQPMVSPVRCWGDARAAL